ncbi:glycosyltransferase [Intrasporangium chromatireducens]|uniref:glycosyltransferase n=1 Tax=Intrasporangium chromatireducens TaxID=1386088 RepID=UPI001F0A96EB|nr:glycosyltransferase [Intrasporangium chromatireducens]
MRNTFPSRAAPPSPAAAPGGLVYAGRLAAFRELEVVAQASLALDLPITLVGPADDSWLAGFDPGRAVVLPSEPLRAVDERLRRAGVALVTHSDRWPNHRLALPNKLFHAVSLGIPVIATDVGELGAMVREHGLGTVYRPGDPDDMARAVHDLVTDYPMHQASVARARPMLSWEQDSQALRRLYQGLADAD